MKSIFGRFIPGKGFLYNFDPRLKVLLTILYIILLFLSSSFIDLLIILFPLVILYIISTKKIRPLIKLLKLPIFVSFVILIVNLYIVNSQVIYNDNYHKEFFWSFYTNTNKELKDVNGNLLTWSEFYANTNYDFSSLVEKYGNNAYLQYGFSLNSVNRSINLFFRIYIMVLTTSLLTNTTRPILLNKAIEDLMWPLKFLFIPTHIIATIISIALRFIPTLVDEAQRIMKAQSSRGVDFKHGTLKKKIIAFTTLIIPLFVSSFQKADDLANSMETRGYDPYEKRTKYRQIKPTWKDFIGLLIFLSIASIIILNTIYFRNIDKNIEYSLNTYSIGLYKLPEVFWILRVVG
ncbi:energy-coupling factor transporter transmembrane component T family protein [Mycoplasmopsis felis]|uniref:energy-coupling factor transporter transmembrane component T family protein n=1 Tax=Mycoplasmopsis felis TaxID=33923 RepID=UPI002AFDD038|nr:energy-coupling factor transporter transmembrane component T [Mycoplasmopsis felis]WQQ04676.1 energy-coupling factor transporter transmembrane component T [Mycoplasmopsis felis]